MDSFIYKNMHIALGGGWRVQVAFKTFKEVLKMQKCNFLYIYI